MPRCCSVIGCKSNYRSEKEFVTTFALPRDECLKSNWLRKIPTDFSGLKNPIVCINHFSEEDIIRTDKCVVNGELKEFERKIPKLKEGAVPCIFPNIPSYLSKTKNVTKRLADVEEEQMRQAISESLKTNKEFLLSKKISCVNDIIHYYNEKLASKGWTLHSNNGFIYLLFLNLNATSGPSIEVSIVIQSELLVKVYIKNELLELEKIPKHLHKLISVDALEELTVFVMKRKDTASESDAIDNVICKLSELISNSSNCSVLEFFKEQLFLWKAQANNRRYTGHTMLLAASLFLHSTSAYISLYQSNLLLLPHPRNIRKLIGSFSLNNWKIEDSVSYLLSKIHLLKENEFVVNLHIDEIYVNPHLHFKGGTIFGSSDDNPINPAKRAQVCMISGVLSNYKDVVTIVPVSSITGLQLYDLLLKVINEIEQIGFRVVAIVSDNNCINRKAFELFSGNNKLESSVPHPVDKNRKLFIIFDAVHLIKCIRNNWISKRNANCCLEYPDFENFEVMCDAEFKTLENMYETEKSELVKYGHTLSYKALFPSAIEKQNVNLALAVFNEKNIAALTCLSTINNNLCASESTSKFLNIILTWWKIANVKSAFEGKRFNDPFREPIRQDSTLQLDFLQKLSCWLKEWRRKVNRNKSLSTETFQAFIISVDSFLDLIPYLFANYRLIYILLSKFQNDVLEGRFGQHRQMSGSNFHISYLQLLESERKLRFQSMVLLATKNTNISLRTLLPCNESREETVDVAAFIPIKRHEFSIHYVPEELLPILTYIAGYIVRRELRVQKCEVCVSWLRCDKTVDVEMPTEFMLIEALDRGKLMFPSEMALKCVCIVWYVLQILVDDFKKEFLACVNQIGILKKLTSEMLLGYLRDCGTSLTVDTDVKCLCSQTICDKLINVCFRGCKILLNNFVKQENTNFDKSNTERKIKKFRV